MFLELQRTMRQIPRAACLEALLDSSDSAIYEFDFNYNPPRYCQDSDLPFPNIEELRSCLPRSALRSVRPPYQRFQACPLA